MKIDGIVVVEGKSDVAFLSNFIDAEFVTTNGSEISKETISYLKNSKKNIYVLTDPDYPGDRIRKVLDENILNLNHCFVEKEKSIKNGKVGVAESTKEEVEKAFKNAVKVTYQIGTITMNDLVALGLSGEDNSEDKRNKISKELNLGHCNAKTFLKRINYSGISIEELKAHLWTKNPTSKTLKHISF